MQQKSGSRPFVLATALLLAFVLLAAALDGIDLASGLRIEPRFTERIEQAFEHQEREARNYYDGTLYSWVVSVVVGLSVVLFFVGLMRKESRLSTFQLVVLGAIAVFLVTRIPPPQTELELPLGENGLLPGSGEEAIATADALDKEDAVDVTVERPEGTRALSWILTGAAFVGLVLVVRPRLPAPRKKPATSGTMEDSARAALRAAEEGGDVLETVVRCYRDMLRIYHQTHGAGRRNTITPRELAGKLAEAGVPRPDAQGLTELFERARYGTVRLTSEEERRALEHMRVIVSALGADGAIHD